MDTNSSRVRVHLLLPAATKSMEWHIQTPLIPYLIFGTENPSRLFAADALTSEYTPFEGIWRMEIRKTTHFPHIWRQQYVCFEPRGSLGQTGIVIHLLSTSPLADNHQNYFNSPEPCFSHKETPSRKIRSCLLFSTRANMNGM